MKTAKEILAKYFAQTTVPQPSMVLVEKAITEYAQAYHEDKTRWIKVEERLPENPMFCLVWKKVLSPYTDKQMNDVFEFKLETIYYFKERNYTGWQNDWTGKPSDVTHWQPLPTPPTN